MCVCDEDSQCRQKQEVLAVCLEALSFLHPVCLPRLHIAVIYLSWILTKFARSCENPSCQASRCVYVQLISSHLEKCGSCNCKELHVFEVYVISFSYIHNNKQTHTPDTSMTPLYYHCWQWCLLSACQCVWQHQNMRLLVYHCMCVCVPWWRSCCFLCCEIISHANKSQTVYQYVSPCSDRMLALWQKKTAIEYLY